MQIQINCKFFKHGLCDKRKKVLFIFRQKCIFVDNPRSECLLREKNLRPFLSKPQGK